jgi:hypothetical protein
MSIDLLVMRMAWCSNAVICPERERWSGSIFPPFHGLAFLLVGGNPKSTQREEEQHDVKGIS